MENELDKLGRVAAPKPSNEARARAVSAAMAAFEAEKKFVTATQGREQTHRQSSIATKLWSMFMSRNLMLTTSALAADAVAAACLVPGDRNVHEALEEVALLRLRLAPDVLEHLVGGEVFAAANQAEPFLEAHHHACQRSTSTRALTRRLSRSRKGSPV